MANYRNPFQGLDASQYRFTPPQLPNLEPLAPPPGFVDRDQLQAELQRAFDAMAKRIEKVEAVAVAQVSVQDLLIGAMVDLELVDPDRLIKALSDIASAQNTDISRQVVEGMIDKVEIRLNTDEPNESHLRLVSQCEVPPDPKDAPDKN